MTRTDGFDVDRQIDALATLRMRSGRGRSRVAVDLGMEADTYRRYETGQTELRVSQIEAFAAAYGVTPVALLQALGFDIIEAPSQWDRYRVELIEAGATSEEAEKIVTDSTGMDAPARHDHLAAVVETWRKAQQSAQDTPARTRRQNRRAV